MREHLEQLRRDGEALSVAVGSLLHLKGLTPTAATEEVAERACRVLSGHQPTPVSQAFFGQDPLRMQFFLRLLVALHAPRVRALPFSPYRYDPFHCKSTLVQLVQRQCAANVELSGGAERLADLVYRQCSVMADMVAAVEDMPGAGTEELLARGRFLVEVAVHMRVEKWEWHASAICAQTEPKPMSLPRAVLVAWAAQGSSGPGVSTLVAEAAQALSACCADVTRHVVQLEAARALVGAFWPFKPHARALVKCCQWLKPLWTLDFVRNLAWTAVVKESQLQADAMAFGDYMHFVLCEDADSDCDYEAPGEVECAELEGWLLSNSSPPALEQDSRSEYDYSDSDDPEYFTKELSTRENCGVPWCREGALTSDRIMHCGLNQMSSASAGATCDV
jgi:hypothetical protein